MLADLVPGEDCLPALLPSYCPYMVGERRALLSLGLSRTLISPWGLTLMTSCNHLTKVPLHWEIGLYHYEWGGGRVSHNSLSVTKVTELSVPSTAPTLSSSLLECLFPFSQLPLCLW